MIDWPSLVGFHFPQLRYTDYRTEPCSAPIIVGNWWWIRIEFAAIFFRGEMNCVKPKLELTVCRNSFLLTLQHKTLKNVVKITLDDYYDIIVQPRIDRVQHLKMSLLNLKKYLYDQHFLLSRRKYRHATYEKFPKMHVQLNNNLRAGQVQS